MPVRVLQWPLVPETIQLKSGQVHLWAAALNEFVEQAPKLGTLLSPAEQARAQKFSASLREIRDRLRDPATACFGLFLAAIWSKSSFRNRV